MSKLESDRKTRSRRERKEIGKDLLDACYIFIEKSKQVSSKKKNMGIYESWNLTQGQEEEK